MLEGRFVCQGDMRLLLIHGLGRTPQNDGVVAVEETRLGPNTEVIRVPAVHTLIMNSPQVRRVIYELLRDV